MRLFETNAAAQAALGKYLDLRDEIDRRCAELEAMHAGHLVCRAGCGGCCENLTVFPVEFYAIAGEMASATASPAAAFDDSAPCGYLRDARCVIYPHRPLICRTHGLPVVFPDHEGKADFSQVSFCGMNFADAAGGSVVFDAANTLDVYALNCELFAINLEFIGALGDERFNPGDRIALKQLVQQT